MTILPSKCWSIDDGTGFGRTDSCSNPRNILERGMEPNHPELGLDPDVARRVNRVQTPKKNVMTILVWEYSYLIIGIWF